MRLMTIDTGAMRKSRLRLDGDPEANIDGGIHEPCPINQLCVHGAGFVDDSSDARLIVRVRVT